MIESRFGCAFDYNLKLGATLGGNYILLDYPACASGPCAGQTGLTRLQCAATSGYFCCVSTSQMIPTIVGTRTSTTIPVEFISDLTPAQGSTWGRLKLLYR